MATIVSSRFSIDVAAALNPRTAIPGKWRVTCSFPAAVVKRRTNGNGVAIAGE